MHQGGVVLQRLHQVGLDCVLEEGRHGAVDLELGGQHGPPVPGVGHDHAAQALLELVEAFGKAEHGHHLGGHRDVVAGLARGAVGRAPQPHHDLAQGPVVHVHHAPPHHPSGIDVQGVAGGQVVVDDRREQVVGHADGVEVPREMQVDVLHGHHLRVAPAGGAALDAEAGAQGGLADAEHRLPSQARQRVGETHGGGGLPFPRGRGGDGGDQDELALGAAPEAAVEVQADLGLGAPDGLQVGLGDPEPGGELPDGQHGGAAGDVDVGGDGAMHKKFTSIEKFYHIRPFRLQALASSRARRARPEASPPP